MPVALDRRTRRDADVRQVSMEEFLAVDFPDLVARHGEFVANGIASLDAPPLAVEIGDQCWSFTPDGATLAVSPGRAEGAVVVTFSEAEFSDWVQNQQSFNAMLVARELRYRGGSERDISIWDSLWLALLEGWPVVDDGIDFLDRRGEPLDLRRLFTPGDDPADIAHFLREAGFLHLRGWIDPSDMAKVSNDIDRALEYCYEGDGRSWWATLRDGTRQCVRLQQFSRRSATSVAILRGARWDSLRQALAGDEELVGPSADDNGLEALVKPVGVTVGASDVSFHRDCHLGRHAYNCSSPVVGIAVTASGEANGQLRVVAGSHRVLIPVEIAKTAPYLPVVAVPTEPGDVTVHLSCTLHESTPPIVEERRVMYTGFALPPRENGTNGNRKLSELRERVSAILLEHSVGPETRP
ncbi:phytanoyl-CoA dioxygenase family protein [Frankia sp. CNm7]|uniref:Phytanoyl-CoA dioxygenase family protein n=1 Tax=Frankia nepalensis TaxID=1836974 RepID=A0A937RKH7_9ACTN|nr:phytanoyl-CoA dioxygenase family protein [Frankia nepalensis]MBL7496339.1 phytanoyl-CoA dioxygenase family protein [Frankia nepalensis]MBL7508464.1 phytanoyl-CoA dioxygenase family protein [Frankia nepalensis]MBL7521628.1 phytanoyl-CoA dioxygenase family protein [Frankia nepalensis]MBL7627596.1 phytanoyl-CoA dioxygenase family protein [Frankia nepalensis]